MVKTMTAGQKKLDTMNVHLLSGEISEYAGNKGAFKSASIAFLKQLSKDIDQRLEKVCNARLIETRTTFNPGGPAIAGNPSLYFMTDMGTGIAVYISEGFHGNPKNIMYRTIRHMSDYCGGNNCWLSAQESYEHIVEKIAKAAYRDAQ